MRRGGIWLAAALLALPVASADWLQDGGVAGRTGAIAGGGPARDEVAFTLTMPPTDAGTFQQWFPTLAPLIIGRQAIVPASGGIYSVDLDTAEVRMLAPILSGGESAGGWASDGRSIFYVDESEGCAFGICSAPLVLRIIPLDGTAERAIPLAPTRAPSRFDDCSVALDDAPPALYVACVADTSTRARRTLSVERRTLEGELEWTWSRDLDAEAIEPAYAAAPDALLVGVSVVGEHVIPISAIHEPQQGLPRPGYYWDGWVINKTTGGLAQPAMNDAPLQPGPSHFGWQPLRQLFVGAPTPHAPSLVVGDGSVEIRRVPSRGLDDAMGVARALFLVGGEGIGDYQLRGVDRGARTAMSHGRAFVSTSEQLAAFTTSGEPLWDAMPPPGVLFSDPALLADDRSVFVGLGPEIGATTEMAAYDARSGALLWRYTLPGDQIGPIAADAGALVFVSQRQNLQNVLVVMGRTGASIGLEASASGAFPAAGEVVRVDASRSTPGAAGPATKFRTDWGDGDTTGWQDSPVMEHTYKTIGAHVAHVYAGNDGGQVTAQAFTFNVGGAPPQNFLQQQFASENQERTFFLLGLLVTAAIGGFGLWRVRQRRGRLARELAALDAAVREARDDPARIDRALDEARYRARGLLLDHKLDEGQHAVLVARIEELSREARVGVVHSLLDFLPMRHVRALQEMLRDGRVSSLERAHFLAVVDQDATLTPEYRERLRRVVDGWASHDAGGRT